MGFFLIDLLCANVKKIKCKQLQHNPHNRIQTKHNKQMLIQTFLQSLILSVCGGSFGCFLVFCFQAGEIFAFWGKVLERLPYFLANPLGACVYCFASWVVILFCFCFDSSFFVYIFALGLNYIYLNILNKLDLL